MLFRTVDIGKTVDYESLEKALIEAAEEVGWHAKVEDVKKKGYRLGSVREVEGYDYTDVHLRGRFLSAMDVMIHGKGVLERFTIFTGFPYGIARDPKVEKYLSAVSEKLQ